MRESRSLGSVRGTASNGRSYREHIRIFRRGSAHYKTRNVMRTVCRSPAARIN